MTSPSAPERIVSTAIWAPGKNGISLEQRTKTSGCARSASTIRVAASRSIPNGFSAKKSFPARIASR